MQGLEPSSPHGGLVWVRAARVLPCSRTRVRLLVANARKSESRPHLCTSHSESCSGPGQEAPLRTISSGRNSRGALPPDGSSGATRAGRPTQATAPSPPKEEGRQGRLERRRLRSRRPPARAAGRRRPQHGRVRPGLSWLRLRGRGERPWGMPLGRGPSKGDFFSSWVGGRVAYPEGPRPLRGSAKGLGERDSIGLPAGLRPRFVSLHGRVAASR